MSAEHLANHPTDEVREAVAHVQQVALQHESHAYKFLQAGSGELLEVRAWPDGHFVLTPCDTAGRPLDGAKPGGDYESYVREPDAPAPEPKRRWWSRTNEPKEK